jgi:hypothetical protein
LDFLAQDDRLCVINQVSSFFSSCLWRVVLDKNDDGNEMHHEHHEKLETDYDHQSSSFPFFLHFISFLALIPIQIKNNQILCILV